MPKHTIIASILAGLIAVVTIDPLSAQGFDANAKLKQGIEAFGKKQWPDALKLFNDVLLDPRSGNARGDASYWTAMSYIASGDVDNAEKAIETFIASFPTHARMADMLYQNGRMAYLKKEYERAIKIFQSFLSAYPGHEFVSSSLFWSAESLFYLGRLAEAERIYKTIAADYPSSVKAEAVQYRLALIQYKYREDELLTLLKWSHEESLKIIEEFQRREKAYEQALAVYQKKYGDSAQTAVSSQMNMETQVRTLNARVEELKSAIAARDASIEKLNADARNSSKAPPAAAVQTPKAPRSDVVPEAELLVLKSEGLDLLAFYLDWLSRNGSNGDKK